MGELSKKDIIIISKKRDPEYISFKFYPEEKKSLMLVYILVFIILFMFTYILVIYPMADGYERKIVLAGVILF